MFWHAIVVILNYITHFSFLHSHKCFLLVVCFCIHPFSIHVIHKTYIHKFFKGIRVKKIVHLHNERCLVRVFSRLRIPSNIYFLSFDIFYLRMQLLFYTQVSIVVIIRQNLIWTRAPIFFQVALSLTSKHFLTSREYCTYKYNNTMAKGYSFWPFQRKYFILI